MSPDESLHDVAIRERQLEAHILRSTDYLRRADRDLKRHIVILYMAIAVLVLFQGLFAFHAMDRMSLGGVILMSVTSVLAIVNCLLLIKTKRWLHRLNEAWLNPQEKIALEALKQQRWEILTNQSRLPNASDSAGLN